MKYRKIEIKEDNGQDIRLVGKSISMTQLAKRLGIDRSYISRVMNNKIITNEKFYIKLKWVIAELSLQRSNS